MKYESFPRLCFLAFPLFGNLFPQVGELKLRKTDFYFPKKVKKKDHQLKTGKLIWSDPLLLVLSIRGGFPLPYLAQLPPSSLQTPTCRHPDTPSPSSSAPTMVFAFASFWPQAFFQHLFRSLLQAEESELNEHHSEQLVAYMRWGQLP